MKEILWIRHAQSIGNAGMPTENRSSFPLSAVGYEQAEALAKKIPFTPDLIVASPFRRAWETAAPT
ncbi:MAG: histidine phosphatase family protein, partial [Schwartzia sp.]|nr:histidine phosphatase family protein [Schwartzia sp. (in: firmicutes)]